MKTKHWLWLLCLAALSGCSEEKPEPPDPNKCDPRCAWGTTCVKGVCIDNSMICTPECEAGFACWQNRCIEESLACKAPCDKDMVCYKGECVEKSKACEQVCDEAAGYECWENKCLLSADICRAGCDAEQTCINGECLGEERICRHQDCDEEGNCTERLEGCAADETCHNGACTKLSSICTPECNATTQTCVDNVCVYQGDYCGVGTCSEDLTQYCNKDAGEFPMWASCGENYGCIDGKCVLKSEFECEPKTCSSNKVACPQGKKVSCHSKYELCDADPASPTAGQCIVDTTATCKPDVCIDGVDNFMCNDKAQPVKCPDNQRCQDGRCIQAVAEDARDLWKVCLDSAECGAGETCIKRMMLDGDYFYLYEMSTSDSIDAGEGICTADCTEDAAVCGNLEGNWSCMLLRGGNYPYKLGAPENKLSAGVDFAAVCRPSLNPETTGWQSDFCAACDEENPCTDPYVCYNGQCVTPCRSNEHCPLFFECKDNADLDLKICQPLASKVKTNVGAYCHACYDADGDGFGVGHCQSTGVDCNDADNTVHYREFYYPDKYKTDVKDAIGEKPECVNKDWNCNGITDSEELLGSLSYCSSCSESSACVPVAQECNAGKCEYVLDYCDPGSCSADGSAYCPNSSLAQWESCKDGYSCHEGQCELTIWETCQKDADCTGTLKTCVKKVLVQGKYVELSTLDSRIPKDAGVCSEDCSDPNMDHHTVCGEQATCQVIVAGKSPWPTHASYPITNLDHNAMKAGVEFAAICRPNPTTDTWSNKFGAECSTDADCDPSYICVKSGVESKQIGECMASCTMSSSNDECPLFHTCSSIIMSGINYRVCKPVAGVESACIDADGDGYGVGHCQNRDVDCNDQNDTVYYSTAIAGICGDSDINCNGIKDSVEHIGSNAHCSACNAPCTDGKVCTNKQCVYDPAGIYCPANTCRMNPSDAKMHQVCDSSKSPAEWANCPSKYHMCEVTDGKAECKLNPEYSCEPGVCVDDYTACDNGVRVDCDSEFEKCSGNACKINESGSNYHCTPNTCFEDVDDFFCNSSKHPEKCPDGQRCQNGACIPVVEASALDMWKVCSDDTQCDYGKCLKSVTMAYTDEPVILADLDPYDSIETSMGVCTFDCTHNDTICNLMTLGDGEPYSCQVIAHGTEGDMLDIAQGIPFASICRPTPDVDAGWSEDFCASCETAPCHDGYSCDPTTKRCLAPCESDAHCPVFFTCQDKMCKPLGTGSCDKCIDMDKDGSGIGHCTLSGYDCKDNDKQYYYTPFVRDPEEADSCANVDRNCNEIKDNEELLGSIYHCGACGNVCGNPATDEDKHIISVCAEGQCKQTCEEGYGYKNGSNVSGGCIKLVDVQPAAVIPLEGVSVYCLDNDVDGYCVADTTWDIWCSSQVLNTCYGYTLVGEEKVWGKLSIPGNYIKYIKPANANTDNAFQFHKGRDCNDNDKTINPSMTEECNGYDDNCNTEIDESFTVPNGHYALAGKYSCTNQAKTYVLEKCADRCTDGSWPIVACVENKLMGCESTQSIKTIFDGQPYTDPDGITHGYYQCTRYLDREIQTTSLGDDFRLRKNPYVYQVYCQAPPASYCSNDQEIKETLNGYDDDGNGLIDDVFINAFDKTNNVLTIFKAHEAKNVTQMSELCTEDVIITHPKRDATPVLEDYVGICAKAVWMPGPGLTQPNTNSYGAKYSKTACVQNHAAEFDFIDDPTDTNCDGFAGDLMRTLFVAVESQDYGAVVENVTDARQPEDIFEYAHHRDSVTGDYDPLLKGRPLASLGKALELARKCMANYNAAGCSRICSIVSDDNGTIPPDLRKSYYCEKNDDFSDTEEYIECLDNEHCEVSLLPWDILMTSGTFNHIDETFDLNYPVEPGILKEKDGWQHYTLTDIKGHQLQNILPNNAVWRIHGGASLNHETWILNKGTTTLNLNYTANAFNQPEDISVFHATSSAKLHLLLNLLNINVKAEGAVTNSYLYEGRSPATLIGLKALNSGRVTLASTKFTLTAPNGANAPITPISNEDEELDGRDAKAITGLKTSNLFSHEDMRQWRRKHEPAAVKDGTLYDYKVCPDGSIVSAGGTGAVSPYSKEAWNMALEEAQDIFAGMGAGYYCPAYGLEDWYIYNFANEVMRGSDNDYLYRKTGLSYEFTEGTSYSALDAYQCAEDHQLRSENSTFSIYDLFVAYAEGACFGTADGAAASKLKTLSGGAAGQSKKFDDTPSTLEISGDNFNFRNVQLRSELRGENGGNGQGGTGAPAFVMTSAGSYSILRKMGPAGVYVQDAGPLFCSDDQDAYSRSIARSIAISYLTAIRFGYSSSAGLPNDGALILRGAGGGTGGCGGLGGEAGYPGGSAIGMILAHDVDIQIDEKSTLKVVGGNGGAGADGQDGTAGGKGGRGLSYGSRSVVTPFTGDTNTYEDMALRTVHAQSGSAGGGGGAGSDGKPGYGLGILIDCSRFKTFAECNIRHNDSIRDLQKTRIDTVLGKARQEDVSPSTKGQDAASPTDAVGEPTAILPEATEGGDGAKYKGTATEYIEIINGKTTDVEKVMSNEKLLYIYNEDNKRVIGSNAQATQE